MFDFLRRARPAVTAAPSSRAVALGAEITRTLQLRSLPRRGTRRFDGATVDRLTSSWRASNNAIDYDLRVDLERLRGRSRTLFKDNEYAAKFGRMVRNNVVGAEGFTLQVRVTDPSGKPDAAANSAIEAAWYRWMRPGNCDVTGRRGFADLVRGIVTALARDGEFLYRKVRGAGYGEFGYQLQLLDVSRIDTNYNRERVGTENAIVMGVELDPFRRPVAYHLLTTRSATAHLSRSRERVPAEEMVHQFMPMEEEQTRGVPWLHAAMRRLNDLNGYREAAVIAARIGACKMGIWETPDGGPPPGADEDDGDGNYVTDAAAGQFDFAPKGYKLHTFDPAYPHDQFDAFCKAALRGIASGIGVAYNGLANDLEGVNFSSIRAGVLDEREEWMAIQNWLITVVLVPLFEEWLEIALLAGAIRLPNGAQLPPAKLDKFRAHGWQGRRWAWVDPLKDIEASVLAIQHRLASPQQIASQAGRDVEDILEDIAAFEALAKAKGVSLPAATPPPAAPKKPEEEPDE